MAKKYPVGVVPPCPGEKEKYKLVDVGGYFHWRRRRGSVKPVQLNAAFRVRADAMTALSPSIKILRAELGHYMQPLPVTRLGNHLFKWLQQAWVDTGDISYSGMKGVDLHDKFRLGKIMKAPYSVHKKDGQLRVLLQKCPHAVKAPNGLATEFALTAVLIKGIAEHIESSMLESPIYSIAAGIGSSFEFVFEEPAALPWLLLLKVSCFEGDQYGKHPMHCGMRVLETDG